MSLKAKLKTVIVLLLMVERGITLRQSDGCSAVQLYGSITAYSQRLEGVYNRSTVKCHGRFVYTKSNPYTYQDYHLQFVEKANSSDFQSWVVTTTRCTINNHNYFRSQDSPFFPYDTLAPWEEYLGDSLGWTNNANLKVQCYVKPQSPLSSSTKSLKLSTRTTRQDIALQTNVVTESTEPDLWTKSSSRSTTVKEPDQETLTAEATQSNTFKKESSETKNEENMVMITKSSTYQNNIQESKSPSQRISTENVDEALHEMEDVTAQDDENQKEVILYYVRLWLPLACLMVLLAILVVVCTNRCKKSRKKKRKICRHERHSIPNAYEMTSLFQNQRDNSNAMVTLQQSLSNAIGNDLSMSSTKWQIGSGNDTGPTIHLNISIPNLLDLVALDKKAVLEHPTSNVTVRCAGNTSSTEAHQRKANEKGPDNTHRIEMSSNSQKPGTDPAGFIDSPETNVVNLPEVCVNETKALMKAKSTLGKLNTNTKLIKQNSVEGYATVLDMTTTKHDLKQEATMIDKPILPKTKPKVNNGTYELATAIDDGPVIYHKPIKKMDRDKRSKELPTIVKPQLKMKPKPGSYATIGDVPTKPNGTDNYSKELPITVKPQLKPKPASYATTGDVSDYDMLGSHDLIKEQLSMIYATKQPHTITQKTDHAYDEVPESTFPKKTPLRKGEKKAKNRKQKWNKVEKEPVYLTIDDADLQPLDMPTRTQQWALDGDMALHENENYEGLDSFYFSSDEEDESNFQYEPVGFV